MTSLALTRYIYMLTESAVDKPDQTEVTDASARSGATLHLVKASEVVSLVRIPSVEWNDAYAQRRVRSG